MSEQKKGIRHFEIEDLITTVRSSMEQCNCVLDTLETFFEKDTLTDDEKAAFLAGYRRYKILLDIATDKSAEALDYLERWNELSPRLMDTLNKEPQT